MKKLLTFLLAAMLSLSMVACGSSNSSTNGNNEVPPIEDTTINGGTYAIAYQNNIFDEKDLVIETVYENDDLTLTTQECYSMMTTYWGVLLTMEEGLSEKWDFEALDSYIKAISWNDNSEITFTEDDYELSINTGNDDYGHFDYLDINFNGEVLNDFDIYVVEFGFKLKGTAKDGSDVESFETNPFVFKVKLYAEHDPLAEGGSSSGTSSNENEVADANSSEQTISADGVWDLRNGPVVLYNQDGIKVTITELTYNAWDEATLCIELASSTDILFDFYHRNMIITTDEGTFVEYDDMNVMDEKGYTEDQIIESEGMIGIKNGEKYTTFYNFMKIKNNPDYECISNETIYSFEFEPSIATYDISTDKYDDIVLNPVILIVNDNPNGKPTGNAPSNDSTPSNEFDEKTNEIISLIENNNEEKERYGVAIFDEIGLYEIEREETNNSLLYKMLVHNPNQLEPVITLTEFKVNDIESNFYNSIEEAQSTGNNSDPYAVLNVPKINKTDLYTLFTIEIFEYTIQKENKLRFEFNIDDSATGFCAGADWTTRFSYE